MTRIKYDIGYLRKYITYNSFVIFTASSHDTTNRSAVFVSICRTQHAEKFVFAQIGGLRKAQIELNNVYHVHKNNIRFFSLQF